MITRRCVRSVFDALFAALALGGLIGLFAAMGLWDERLALAWMVGSFGASITLLMVRPISPLASPYHALVGNGVSAVIGVACQSALGHEPMLASVVALMLAVCAMSLLGAWYPPGGATALLAVLGGTAIHRLGWWFPVTPILLGTGWLVLLEMSRQRLLPIAQRTIHHALRQRALVAGTASPEGGEPVESGASA